MQELIQLNAEIQTDKIERKDGFKSLLLKSANVTGEYEQTENPFIKMILKGDDSALTLYSHLVPGTQTLNCFDILLTASTISNLSNAIFHTLICIVPDGCHEAQIDLVFEVE